MQTLQKENMSANNQIGLSSAVSCDVAQACGSARDDSDAGNGDVCALLDTKTEFVRVLGRGAFGEVRLYRLRNDPNVQFAVKFYHSVNATQQSESRAQEAAAHRAVYQCQQRRAPAGASFVVPFVGTAQCEGNRAVLVMPYFEQGTLQDVLDGYGRRWADMSDAERQAALAYLDRAVDNVRRAIEFLHSECNYWHNDTKLANVLVARVGALPVLSDFGLSRPRGGNDAEPFEEQLSEYNDYRWLVDTLKAVQSPSREQPAHVNVRMWRDLLTQSKAVRQAIETLPKALFSAKYRDPDEWLRSIDAVAQRAAQLRQAASVRAT